MHDSDTEHQLLEEDIAKDIIATQARLDELESGLPLLIQRQSNAKRDLDVQKSQIKYLRERIRGRQSVLRSLRP
jgi:peptidoglycan hydrolase CwlO-like protein